MFFTYIIQSQTSGKFYVGHTANLDNRLREHNSGESKSTRNKGPWILVHSDPFATRSEAQKHEYEIKSKKSSESIKRIILNSKAD
jgi:putative endonuclease